VVALRTRRACRLQADGPRLWVASYELREKELLAENAELRQALLRLQQGMQELTAMAESGTGEVLGALETGRPANAGAAAAVRAWRR